MGGPGLFRELAELQRAGMPVKRSPLHRKPKRPSLNEPGRVEWKTERAGWCAVCERFQLRLAHHHVIYEQHVRLERGDPWDPANGMYVCDICHRHHHDAFARIPRGKIPAEAKRSLWVCWGSMLRPCTSLATTARGRQRERMDMSARQQGLPLRRSQQRAYAQVLQVRQAQAGKAYRWSRAATSMTRGVE